MSGPGQEPTRARAERPGLGAGEAAASVTDTAWDPALTHKMRVLLHTGTLHNLKRGDTSRDPELRHYDAMALAIKVIDLIIDSMGMEKEADRSTVERVLAPLLLSMDEAAGKAPDATRHQAMSDKILSALRNDADSRRPFDIEYQDFDEEGRAVRRKLEFRLVEDHHHPSGGTVLHLSNEAINLYLNALELDIEDAQAAAEAVVQSQLARGKFNEAIQSARNARWQSIRYGTKIGRILADTRRDVDSVDWRDEVPTLLSEALKHIDARLDIERSIINAAREKLELLREADEQAQQVAQIVKMIEECRVRHSSLHKQLIGARTVFLEEQARQSFVRSRGLHLPDLLQEVVEPLLRMGREDATCVVDGSYCAFVGPRAPSLLSLADQIAWQLQPRRAQLRGLVPVPDHDLTEFGLDPQKFLAEVQERVQAILVGISGPTLLSEVLARSAAEGAGQEALELLCLCALQEYAPEDQRERVLSVEKHGEGLLEAAGFVGDELELGPLARE